MSPIAYEERLSSLRTMGQFVLLKLVFGGLACWRAQAAGIDDESLAPDLWHLALGGAV